MPRLSVNARSHAFTVTNGVMAAFFHTAKVPAVHPQDAPPDLYTDHREPPATSWQTENDLDCHLEGGSELNYLADAAHVQSGEQHKESENHHGLQYKSESLLRSFFAKKTAVTMLSTVMVMRVAQISASANRTIKTIQRLRERTSRRCAV
ncbi:hypothetical protein DD238_006481 [Peronospora effusa]|uniref:Uncharacterized protein n=1 Tax=Peronospora effusa TaxID=542832 RepID=A0A3M6VQP3_9STRA|nr:hypothetical protein DD238_006481 [Peronospora effusa]